MVSLGETIGRLIRDKEDMKQTLAPNSGILPVFAIAREIMKARHVNLVITKIDFAASNAFILGHANNGILGTANGLGGGQIVLGLDGNEVTSEILRRRYEWRSNTEFTAGVPDANISIAGGALQLK